MKATVTWVLAGTAILVLAVGGELLYLHHRNQQDQAAPVEKAQAKSDPDDLVFLKHEHPMSLKDEKDLAGRTLWVSAGGQMDFYPYNGRSVDYDHSQGVLLGAQPLVVKTAVEQAAPKKAAFRIPQGDKQVLLVFTTKDDPKQYAVPVGYRDASGYTFLTDEIFFYVDPHKLFDYWSPDVWKAIDEHRAISGMTERQVMMALGQISDPHGDRIGDRVVEYDDQGHPKLITFQSGKATTIVDARQ